MIIKTALLSLVTLFPLFCTAMTNDPDGKDDKPASPVHGGPVHGALDGEVGPHEDLAVDDVIAAAPAAPQYTLSSPATSVPAHKSQIVYNADRNVWIGFEKMDTPDKIMFWQQRLGLDARVLLTEKEVRIDESTPSVASLAGHPDLDPKAMEATILKKITDPTEQANMLGLIPMMIAMRREQLSEPKFKTVLISNTWGSDDILDLYKGDLTPSETDILLKFAPDPGSEMPTLCGYQGAWRGFAYNLRNALVPGKDTWVAYVASADPATFMDDRETAVHSRHLQMMMSVQVGNGVYSPLGICRSPLATFWDKEESAAPLKRLSLLLHKQTAATLGDLYPETSHVIIRPLDRMRKILQGSGLPLTLYDGTAATPREHPYIVRHHQVCELVTERKIPPHPLFIVNPGTTTALPVPPWFMGNEFLGVYHFKAEAMGQFPFVTIDRASLAQFALAPDLQMAPVVHMAVVEGGHQGAEGDAVPDASGQASGDASGDVTHEASEDAKDQEDTKETE